MKTTNLFSRFILWRVKHVPNRQFMYLLSLVVGIFGGLAAILLKNTVHATNQLLTHHLPLEKAHILYFAYPLLGILLTVLFVRLLIRDNIGHGVSRILFAISRRKSLLRPHNNYSSMVGSTLTVGFGGSVGLEAPIVLTGASLGSNLGRILRLNYRNITLLIGCGTAGAIAGIFKAPIAAVVFALEVLMLDLTLSSIIPLLIASVTGATVANFLLGKEVVFYFTLKDPFVLANLPYYVILGILCGLVSFYFTRATILVEGVFGRMNNPYHKLIAGGLLLGLFIFIFPPLYGEGYESLKVILGGKAHELANTSWFYSLREHYWVFLGFIILIILFKVIAMAITTGSGGVGGIFAPTLFIGGMVGFVTSRVINGTGLVRVSESNLSLVGMAGMMAGVMHAPLTAIFLIAELTGGYGLFIPLIITSTISFLTVRYFEPHSIYAHRLAQRGELLTHQKDQAVLTLMSLEEVIEKDLLTVHPDQSLGELVGVIARSKRNVFPVTDRENRLLGVVLLDQIRDIIFNPDMYGQIHVENLMILPPANIDSEDSMETVMKKFTDTGAWNLPVVKDGKYVGMVSKSKMFSVYRKWLRDISV